MSLFKNLFKKKQPQNFANNAYNNHVSYNPIVILSDTLASTFGYNSELYDFANEILINSKKAVKDEERMLLRLVDFFNNNVDYQKRLDNETITLNGYQFKLGFILELMMIGHSDVCCQYLINNNFLIINGIGEPMLLPLVDSNCDYSTMSYEEKDHILYDLLVSISYELTDADFEFLDLVIVLLQELNQLRMETDELLYGYSNLNEDNLNEYPAITYPARTNIGFNHWCKSYLEGNYYCYKNSDKCVTVFNIIDTFKFYMKIVLRYSNVAIHIQNLQKVLCMKFETSANTSTSLIQTIEGNNPTLANTIKSCIKDIST